MEAVHPGSTSEPQVPKPLALYEFIPDDLFQGEGEEIYDDYVGTEIYEDINVDAVPPNPPPALLPDHPPLPPLPTRLPPPPLPVHPRLPPLPTRPPPPPHPDHPPLPPRQTRPPPPPQNVKDGEPDEEDIYDIPVPYASQPTEDDNLEVYAYLDPHAPPPVPDASAPTPPNQIYVSGNDYTILPVTTEHKDAEDLYMGLIYEPPKPLLQPPPPLPVRRPPPPSLQHPSPLPSHPPPPPPPIQPPAEKGQTHAALAERVAQYLDPSQLGVLIQMLQQLQGKTTPSERLPKAALPTVSVDPPSLPAQDSNLGRS